VNKHIFLVISLLLLAIGGRLFFLNVSDWLSVSEEPRRSDVIICLNGDKDRVPKAVELFRQGYAGKILVTYAETRKLVTGNGVPDEAVLSLDSRPNSTYEEALGAIQFMVREKFKSAIIVSDPYHMYRVKWTYGHLTASDAMQITCTAYEAFWAKGFWWDQTRSRLAILNEVPKVIYYWITHGFLGIDYDPLWLTTIDRWYNKMLKHFV
jgi:uncharacterized SAM-binding protein YcdF (DUF218 family)